MKRQWVALVSAVLFGSHPHGVGAEEETPAPSPPPSLDELRRSFGDSPHTRAVDRALEFLRKEQLEDGSWLSEPAGGEGTGYGRNTGIVSLAVMAFLARGHEPGRGPYGEALDRALAWLLRQRKRGLLVAEHSHGPMYSHGITTLLLGEVIGMVDERRPGMEAIRARHREAVRIILAAQSVPKDRFHFGGWRYQPQSVDSDLSVTGWQLLALRAAQDAGFEVPQSAIERAVAYVRRCAHPRGGFAYQPEGEPGIGMTGTGILALELAGRHGTEEARRGGDWLLAHPLEWRGPYFYYGAYYATQAMYQLGGRYWKTWRKRTEPLLLEKQSPDGSWPLPPNASYERDAGLVYTTALAVLTLSVDFHYLPIYQR